MSGPEEHPQPDITMEDLAQTDPERAAELERVFEKTPLEQITKETGLGLNELSQVVTVEANGEVQSGTLAQAIATPDCPAGKMVRGRYKRQGFDGVENLLGDWGEDDPGLKVNVTDTSRQREKAREQEHRDNPETPAPETPAVSSVTPEVPETQKKNVLSLLK